MIQSTELAALATVRHGFFTREGGHSRGDFASLNCGFGSGDDKDTVARNRAIAAERLGVEPGSLLTVWQWHSADAIAAEKPWDVRQPPAGDAIATAVPGLAIGVLTADCTPILFADGEAGVVGAAHAGWQGALNGVTDSAVAAMEKLGARRGRIVAAIGPTISQASYETGPEFRGRFEAQDQAHARFFTPSERARHFMFDLPGYVALRLHAAGVGLVADMAICTYRDEARFFSFRRATHRQERDYGRQISAIALAG